VSLFDRLTGSLRKTRQLVADGLERAIGGSARIDERLFEELEETLLRGDVGPATTEELLSRLRRAVREKGVENPGEIPALLRGIAAEILEGAAAGPAPPAMERPARRTAEGGSGVDPGGVDGAPPPAPSAGVAPRPARPHVILVCGVNGVGKTTTIAKLARRYAVAGKSVLVVAADTFRAAASEQLAIWAKRAGAEFIPSATGADPAAVAFDGVRAGVARGMGVVIVDTAGRLHAKTNLMEELKKIHRVAGKALDGAPHEVLLVLDATIGQNGLAQAREFLASTAVTGLVLAKLDGTARGGVVLAIARETSLPVRYVGVGEGLEDLEDFDPRAFARALIPVEGDE